ncbi:MAG: PAS domain S-box protein [Fibrobacter sp.]|nr:PAS domain S-box protein [Fibrobacter sp.]
MNSFFIPSDISVSILLFIIVIVAFSLFFLNLKRKSPIRDIRSFFLKNILPVIFSLVTIVFAGGLYLTQILGRNAEKHLLNDTEHSLNILKAAFESNLEKIDAAAASLASSASILQLFQNNNTSVLNQANRRLDLHTASFDAAVVYILDTSGNVIASSNRNTAQSFVGMNYAFRPYFQAAIKGNKGSYFAQGVTSGSSGYYSSAPIIDTAGKIIGVAVIKDEMKRLDSIFNFTSSTFLVDKYGIVFLSKNKNYLFKSILPLTDSTAKVLLESRQFGAEPVKQLTKLDDLTGKYPIDSLNAYIIRIPLKIPDWYLTSISPKSPVIRNKLFGIACTFAIILIILTLASLIVLYRLNEWADNIYLSEKRFQTLFEHAPDAIVICDTTTGKIVASNYKARKWMQECTNKTPANLSDFVKQLETDSSGIQKDDSNNGDVIYTLQTETELHHLSVSKKQINFQSMSCDLIFLRDISNLIRIRNELAASEQKYRELTEFLPEAVFETNENGTIIFTNKRGFEMFGYSENTPLNEFSIFNLMASEDREKVRNALERFPSTASTTEYSGLHSSGRKFPVQIHSSPMMRNGKFSGLCGIAIDLTERIKFEEELYKKDKLEALGILAGGIAHDFNNLLTAIWAGVSLIRLKYNNADDVSTFNDVENALKRGKELTSQLLTYSKGGEPVKEAQTLVSIVRDAASLALAGSHCKHTITDQDSSAVEIDRSQISQVIQNVVLNAKESMSDGGVINILLRNTDISSSATLDNGRYVEIIISDTGCGIDKNTLSQIFDPFFSTKPSRSGLGLTTSFSILKRHRGYIFAESDEGKGTQIHIFLPAFKQLQEKKVSTSQKTSIRNSILIMDDEIVIRSVAEKLLTHMGYRVTAVENGEQAITEYTKALESGNKYDLVILDLTIPAGMGGKDTMKKLLEIDPDIVAIVSSGYSNDPIMAKFSEYGFKGVITKPYSIGEFHNVIQSVLNR